MLETERHDREPDNDGPAGAGDSADIGSGPAETGPDAGPQGKDAGGGGRRLFRRGRRAASRPAGPPAGDLADDGPPDSGPAGDSGAVPEADAAAPQAAAPPPAAAGAPASRAAASSAASRAAASSAAPQDAAPAAAPPWSADRPAGSPPAVPATFAAPPAAPAFTAPPAAEPARGSREALPAQVRWQPQESRRAQEPPTSEDAGSAGPGAEAPAAFQPPLVIFQPPEISSGGGRRAEPEDEAEPAGESWAGEPAEQEDDGEASGTSKRRRRGGRGKGRGADEGTEPSGEQDAGADKADEPAQAGGRSAAEKDAPAADRNGDSDGADSGEGAGGGRRRRRRRRSGAGTDTDAPSSDDPPNTVVHVRAPRSAADDLPDVRGVKGSTRLEAKRQRRREGRESGRRRPPIITESEFLARREAVERVMVVRQHADRTQIAVLEDGILVEHYVDKASHQSYVGNVYLGRVQNVLPSMEAAFVDIGKGRNAVLYAGEVNFDASGLEGESKRIESALKSGQSILVQATKDPIGHKGARLTSQVSLPGRYLVYVPGANMTGISRKLPDTERTRLKQILKQVMPEHAGVIVRTAAEGATEEELSHDVARLAAQWEAIERKSKSASAPELLYSEPDLTIRVVRDIFNEDFTKLVIAGDGDWDMVDEYVRYVAPHLAERLERWTGSDHDVFAAYRIDEQIAKALERKVWLPSGGSLVIDTTEAMTVIDVNTGKFTGQGGNLEQTVTRNNLEAAEEIVRQLRVRDVGGIIVIDFIDMVLESNRDLVLRRLLECLARDRTKHQVAEVTSLGLVQMTRKRVGSGLLEAFSVPCDCCNGRGVLVSLEPVDHASPADHHHGRDGGAAPRGGSSRGGRGSRGGAKDAGRGSANGAAAVEGTGAEGTAEERTGEAAADKSGPRPRAPIAANGGRGSRPADDGPAEAPSADGTPAAAATTDGEPASSRRASGRRRRRAAEARTEQPADRAPDTEPGEARADSAVPAGGEAGGIHRGEAPARADSAVPAGGEAGGARPGEAAAPVDSPALPDGRAGGGEPAAASASAGAQGDGDAQGQAASSPFAGGQPEQAERPAQPGGAGPDGTQQPQAAAG